MMFSRPGYRRSGMWRNPSVRNVVVARFVSRAGGEAAFFVGIWGKAAFTLEANPTELAFVMGALGVASLIGASVAGVLVDRFDPRKVVLVGEILFVPAALAMILANSIPTLVATTFMLALVGTPVFTAISSFAPFLTDDDDELARVNGLIEGASWTAFVVGPAIGALLAGTIGVDAIFVFDAATSLAAALLIIPVKVRDVERTEDAASGWQELKDGFSFTYGHRRLRFYILLGSVVWLLFGTFSALEPLFFRDVLGVEVETLGWVNSIFGLGLVSGTLIAARLPSRFRTATVLTVLVGLNAVGVLLYVGTDMLGVVVAAGVFWGLIIGMMAPLHRTMIQLNSPSDLVGRIMGVNHIHSEVGHLLPLVIAPGLAAAFGVQLSLILAGCVVAVSALGFLPGARRLDRTRDRDVPPTGLPDPAEEPKTMGAT